MTKVVRERGGLSTSARSGLALTLMVGMATFSVARADEKEAKSLLKAMSDYMAAQQAISFDYDANLEIVTADKQKLALASSGTVAHPRHAIRRVC
jgi:hypothetical protein